MIGSDVLVSTSSLSPLGWTLLHSLWQGALVAAGLAGTLALLRRGSANVRYAVSCAALVLVVTLPVATFIELRTRPMMATAAADPARSVILAALQDSAPQVTFGGLVLDDHWASTRLEPLLPWAVLIWFGGVSLLTARFLWGWMRAQSLRRRRCRPAPRGARATLARLAERMGETRRVMLLESGLVEVPTVLGFLRPVILVPASLFTGFSARQIEMLLLHELAHIRRHDYLVNLFQALAEILLFYHPAVWWISRCIRSEREDCCDDAAVAACGDAIGYARTLADLEAWRHLPAQWAVAATGGSLLHRVRRLVESRHQTGGSGAIPTLLAALMAAMVVMGAGTEVSSSVQEVQSPPAGKAAGPELSTRPAPLPTTAAGPAVEEARTPRPAAPRPRRTQARVAKQAERPSRAEGPASDELAAALERYGAAKPTPGQLAELKRLGVTPWVLERMQDLGYGGLPADDLLAARRLGVTPWTLAELQDAGYGELSMEQILELRRYGVTPATLKALEKLGYKGLDPRRLVEMGALGVTPSFLKAVQASGRGDLSLDQILELRRRGVTASSLARADEVLRDNGGDSGSPQQ